MDLRTRLQESLTELLEIKEQVDHQYGAEDWVYRLYHQSFKVYHAQAMTKRIVDALQRIVPGKELNPIFLQIVQEGTGKTWSIEANRQWTRETRPIVEALFHARYFLDMAVKYGQENPETEIEFAGKKKLITSGYAALLELYGIRDSEK